MLVLWTDLIFLNGSTVQIVGTAGTDADAYDGFQDKFDLHLWQTFGRLHWWRRLERASTCPCRKART